MQGHSFGHSNYASTIRAVPYWQILQTTMFNCLECESPVSLDRDEYLCSQNSELHSPLHCERVILAALCNQCLYLLMHKSIFSTVRFGGMNALHLTDKLVLSTCHMHVRRAFSMLSSLQSWSLVLCSCFCSAGLIQASVQLFKHLPSYREILNGPGQCSVQRALNQDIQPLSSTVMAAAQPPDTKTCCESV